MFRNAYQPGDTVPQDAYYWVHHYRHRLAHICRTRFVTFPTCRICGDRVRFEIAPVQSYQTGWLRDDPDFEHACGKIALMRDDDAHYASK